LVIHVNEDAFGYMPEIVKIVDRKVGKLTNVRLEVDLDMHENGVKLESENNIIDGSLEAQFNTIDRLFQNVGVNA
jgi:flagellar assembly protein FliH